MALTSRDLAALVNKATAKRTGPVVHMRPPAESTTLRLPERPTVVVEAKPTKPTQVPSTAPPDEDRVRGTLTASAGARPKTLQFTARR
jgi:hypothetical protein